VHSPPPPAAAEAYLSGDWACVTRLGLLLLNSVFLCSPPALCPPQDPALQLLYQGLKLLMQVAEDAFSSAGVRYCLDMERSLSVAETQFRERRAATSGHCEPPLPCEQPAVVTGSGGGGDGLPPAPPPLLCKPCI
jgi:hypothetical protein